MALKSSFHCSRDVSHNSKTTESRFEDFIAHVFAGMGMGIAEIIEGRERREHDERNTPIYATDGFRSLPSPCGSSHFCGKSGKMKRMWRISRRQTEVESSALSDSTTQTETSTSSSATTSASEATLTTTTSPTASSEVTTTTSSESTTTTSPESSTTTTTTTTSSDSSSTTTTTTSAEPTPTTTSSDSSTSSSSPSSVTSTSSSISTTTTTSDSSSSPSSLTTSSISSASSDSTSSTSSYSTTTTTTSTTASSSPSSLTTTPFTLTTLSTTSSTSTSTSASASTLPSISTSTSFSAVTTLTTAHNGDGDDTPPTTTTLPTITKSQSPTSGVLNTGQPSSGNRFAQNKGAIIGVSVGGVVFVILAVVVLFFLCQKWRSRHHSASLAGVTQMGQVSSAPPLAGTRRSVSKGGTSGSGGSSRRRMLNRNQSSSRSANSEMWRSPLSDEDLQDDVPPPPLPTWPSAVMAVGGAAYSSSGEEDGSPGASPSTSGHGHSSLNLHEYYQQQYVYPSGSGSAVEVGRKPSVGGGGVARQNSTHMRGFGQAAEDMVISGGGGVDSTKVSPTVPAMMPTSLDSPSLIQPSPPTFVLTPNTPPPSAYMMYYGSSSSSHDHSSSSSHHYHQRHSLDRYQQPESTSATANNNSEEFNFGKSRASSSLGNNHTTTTTATTTNVNPSANSHSSSSGSGSRSQPSSPGVPRVRIHESSPPIPTVGVRDSEELGKRRDSVVSLKGFISRLRNGTTRHSSSSVTSGEANSPTRDVFSQQSSSGCASPPGSPTSTTFAASSGMGRTPSSLLNPPPQSTPVPGIVLAPYEDPIVLEGGHPVPTPFSTPSPAPMEDASSVRVTEGLLDPRLLSPYEQGSGGAVEAAGGSQSVTSLRDYVDYSRPYQGFVFNRMGSSVTFASTLMDSRTPGIETPASLRVEIEDEEEYPFGGGIGVAR